MLLNLYIEFTFFFSTVTSVASKTEPFLLEGSLARITFFYLTAREEQTCLQLLRIQLTPTRDSTMISKLDVLYNTSIYTYDVSCQTQLLPEILEIFLDNCYSNKLLPSLIRANTSL